jgi:hypothetical protein
MGSTVYSEQGKEFKNATDEQLYYMAEHWRDDLAFFKDEIHFFHELMDMLNVGGVAPGKKLKESLTDLHLHREALAAKINVHLHDYALLEQDVLAGEEWRFRKVHSQAEKEFADFWKSFRLVKADIFTVAGAAMKKDRK